MRLTLLTPSLVAALAAATQASAQAAESPTYVLLHRHVDASGSHGTWRERAHVRITSAPDAAAGVEASVESVKAQSGANDVLAGKSEGWYQVLLRGADQKGEQGWIASAKACALPAPLTLTLHLPPATLDLTDEEALRVRALSLFAEISEAEELDERGCPKERRSANAEEEELKVNIIRALGAGAPPPRIPIVKPDGSVLKEGETLPPQKSFVQKYWYYLVPLVIMLAIPTELADSGDNEDGEGADDGPPRVIVGGGGAKAGGAGAARGGAAGGARRR